MSETSPLIRYLIYGLWTVHPILQCVMVAVMLRRKLSRMMPMFFAYIISQIVMFTFSFPAYLWGNQTMNFYLWWTTTGISAALGFMVIREIFLDVFRPFPALRDFGSILFRWAGIVMGLVAVILMAAGSQSDHVKIVQYVLSVERGVRVMQCGLTLFMVLFSSYLGLSWKNRSFGLAIGFGGVAALEMGLMVYRSRVGYQGDTMLSIINMTGYTMALATWLFYLMRENPARRSTELLLKPVRWNESMADVLHPVSRDSLLPMFEGIVDRALSRSVAAAPEEKPAVQEPVKEPAPARIVEPRPVFVARPLALPSIQHG
jgi:hypothetical protein